MYRNFLVIIVVLLFSCSESEFKSNKTQNSTKSDSLMIVADSLFRLGVTYCEDSLNQEIAQEFLNESLELYKQLKHTFKIAKSYKWLAFTYDYLEEYENEKKNLEKALELYAELDEKVESAIVMNFLGITYTLIGDIDSALIYYNKGMDLSQITRDTMEILELFQNIGITYQYTGDFEKAASNHIKALKYCEEINYNDGIFSMSNNIAQDYLAIEDLDKALYYCNKAEEIIDSIDDYFSEACYYHTIAEVYFGKSDFIKAKEYYQKTLDISVKSDYKRGMAAAYSNLATIALKDENYKEAEKYAELSLELERKINNFGGEILSLTTLAETQYYQNKNIEAVKLLKEATEMCQDKGMTALLPNIYNHFYKVYKLNKNYKIALKYFEDYSLLKDSLKSVEIKEKIADLEIKHETEKKQQEIILLSKENETKKQKLKARNLLIISLILLVIVIISIAYFFRQRGMQRLNKMESELQKYILKVKDLDDIQKDEPEITSNAFSKKYDLTERETEVLHLISEGMSNADIAEKIFVSTNTIKFHIKNIYLKLDVKNRVEVLNKFNR